MNFVFIAGLGQIEDDLPNKESISGYRDPPYRKERN